MRRRNVAVFLTVCFGIFMTLGCGRVWKSDIQAEKGKSLFEKGKYLQAENTLKQAIHLRRESAKAHYYLALTYLKTDRYEKALSLMRYFIEYIERTNAWVGPGDDEFIAKIKELYVRQTGEIPVRRVPA
jgi:tetratricopeptide (TPR) repeat protein